MRILFSSLALTTAFVSASIAGSVETNMAAPTSIAAPASIADWSGFYAGGLVSLVSGEMDYYDGDFSQIYPFDDSGMYGLFGGYNHQMGSFVIGGEAAFQVGEFVDTVYPDDHIDNIVDVKLRAGYVVGNALLFASGGYSTALYTESDDTYFIDATGFNVGAGVDYKITDRIFAGIEYVYRDVGGDYRSDTDEGGNFAIQAVQLRAGMQF